MTVLFAEMTRQQIRTLAPTALAILPTASIEQHGPHLPLGCDTVLVERLADDLSMEFGILVAPTDVAGMAAAMLSGGQQFARCAWIGSSAMAAAASSMPSSLRSRPE